jgi:hypothetical protein
MPLHPVGVNLDIAPVEAAGVPRPRFLILEQDSLAVAQDRRTAALAELGEQLSRGKKRE